MKERIKEMQEDVIYTMQNVISAIMTLYSEKENTKESTKTKRYLIRALFQMTELYSHLLFLEEELPKILKT